MQPISLLNVDCKIGTYCIAQKVIMVIPQNNTSK